jgi:ribonuclease Z
MGELCFIGTGGSVPTEERDNTSFLLKIKDLAVLVDCPGSVTQKIKKSNLDSRNVGSMIVTHTHPDHIYGLPSLVHSLMLDDCSINIYGSELSVEFCGRLLDLFNLRDEKIKCRVNFIPVASGETRPLSPDLSCSFYRVPHSLSSLAVRFHLEEEDLSMIYSGDTPACPDLFQWAKNSDYLIHDCSAPSRFFKKYPQLHSMHTDSLTLGKMAQKAGVHHLVPCHFFGELDFSLKEIVEEIMMEYRGNLIMPKDFRWIPLSAAE